MPAVSIIIPIFNVEKYLDECLLSIVKQSFNDIEVIMVNDGSTDNSGAIAKSYAGKYKNFILIEQDNSGLSASRNKGLSIATGKYIMYVDSDDYLEVNAVEALFHIAEAKKLSLLIFSGKKCYCDENDKVIKFEDFGPKKEVEASSALQLYCKLRETNNYYTGVYYQFINREILIDNDVKFIEGILHEDHLYTFQVFMNATTAACITDKFYNYRVRVNSIMTSNISNLKRFDGFAKTYCVMSITLKKYFDKFDDNTIKFVKSHINYVGWLAAKYYIKMSKDELDQLNKLVDEYFNCMRKDKYLDFKMNTFLKFHKLIKNLYGVIRD